MYSKVLSQRYACVLEESSSMQIFLKRCYPYVKDFKKVL